MSVSMVVVVPTDNSPPTLRVEALSPSNGPTANASVARLNLTFDEDIQNEGTRTVDLCTNSVAGSGAGYAHAEYVDGSFAVHPVISENVSWRTLVVVLDQELHPNQTVYVLIDARAALDSSVKLFVGLAGSDFNFSVAEQVVVPDDTMTFVASEASIATTMVVSFAETVQLAGINVSFRIAFRVKAEVLCGKNTMIGKVCRLATTTVPTRNWTSRGQT